MTDMKTKHTPGPWHVERPYGEPGVYIAGPNTGLIAKLYETDKHLMNQDCKVTIESNARLIAAAPTMYDYLTLLAESGDKQAHAIISQITRS